MPSNDPADVMRAYLSQVNAALVPLTPIFDALALPLAVLSLKAKLDAYIAARAALFGR